MPAETTDLITLVSLIAIAVIVVCWIMHQFKGNISIHREIVTFTSIVPSNFLDN